MRLCHWLSPVIPFTAEEAWLSYKGLDASNLTESIHLSTMPDVPAQWRNEKLAQDWARIADVRRVVTGALEPRRAAKEIGASLEASPTVHVTDKDLAALLRGVDFADVCIVSGVTIVEGAVPADAFTLAEVKDAGVVFAKAPGEKCARCWKYTQDTGSDAAHPDLCARCTPVAVPQLKAVA